MKKIRINELARDLEVKAHLILEKLPELGVTEKKTHSSSVDEDVAEKLRDHFVGGGSEEHRERLRPGARGSRDFHEESEEAKTTNPKSTSEAGVALQELPSPTDSGMPATPGGSVEQSASGEPSALAEEPRPAQRSSLRPPLAAPLRPPVANRTPGTASPEPVVARPSVHQPVQQPAQQPAPNPVVQNVLPNAGAARPLAPRPFTPPAVGQPAIHQPALHQPAVHQPGAPSRPSPQAPAPAAPRSTQPAPPVVSIPVASIPAASVPAAALANPEPPSALAGPSTPATPAPAMPAAPVPVSAAPAIPPAPGRPAPPAARPIPSAPPGPARPGQVLSGPRAPLPAGMATPRPPVLPGTPRPQPQGPRPQAGQPLRHAGAARPGVTPGSPISPRPSQHQTGSHPGGAYQPASHQTSPAGAYQPSAYQGSRPLVGQPAPRPIVPPRPDLARKLTEQQRATSPAAPAQPRPGMPQRPPQMPAPGRPIFPGARTGVPQRPGQSPYARTGAPGSRPGGPRPMHPTSRPGQLGAVGLVPAPTPDQARRAPNRGSRPQPRDREREADEKLLRPMRRERDAGPPPINRDITISEGVTVKELSEKLDVKANLVIKKLLDRGIFATINQTLDSQLATEIAREFGASTSTVTFEEEAMFDVEIAEEAKDLFRRPPVVTIMGHVDHGKTSLLDAIRHAHVADREAGGITQHIGAYFIEKNDQKIVFIDTPGHEAFTRMRSRGAKVTDVVVLVVAADDGVMPQTLEAIDHARAAKVPIVVAINKIDKPDAQPDRIKQQLSDRGLLAEDWGGDVVMVPVSARTRVGLDSLLEMILLVSELADLKANPSRPAMGSVIESKLDKGRGPVATVLVRNGTLRVGDFFICGEVFGKVRALINDRGEQLREAGPSMPVEVLGLQSMPDAGDEFQVVTDTAKAKQIVLYREEKTREEARAKNKRLTLEQFQKQMAAGETKELPIILKADVAGSAEVLSDTLQKLSTDKVRINVLRAGVGAINEGDVLLASASNGIVIGFNVKPDRKAEATAEHEKVDIRLHSIIYHLTDELTKAMTGLLEPVFREIPRGKAEVRNTFRVSKVGNVAGCLVTDGIITRDSLLRVVRDGVVVHKGRVGSLRRFKDDASEVRSGMECGITVDNFGDVRTGDVLEAYITERIAPDLGAAAIKEA